MFKKNSIEINLFILGFGRVGQELACQIETINRSLSTRMNMQIRIRGLADSQAILYRDEGFTSAQIQSALADKHHGLSLEKHACSVPLERIESCLKPQDILVDTTASPHTLPHILHAIEKGTGVVLANKHPLCGPWEEAQKLFLYPRLKYEATVGAGLPAINTLKYLLNTGDQLNSIVGCLSGTLGYLCSRLEEGTSYSEAVKEAHSLGYTEPDPRQDLAGTDVARKAVILARTAGIPAEVPELLIEPLFPVELENLSVSEFLQLSAQEDPRYAEIVERACANQKVPRFTACISPTEIRVGLQLNDRTGTLGSLKGADNYIAFHTTRYSPSPLVLSGPGAGIAVTAAGVLGDILQLASETRREPDL